VTFSAYFHGVMAVQPHHDWRPCTYYY